jgi:hypothetical protein
MRPPTPAEIAGLMRDWDSVAVPSEAEAEFLAGYLGDKRIVVIPRPFDSVNPDPPLLASRPYRYAVLCPCAGTPDPHERLQTDLHGHHRDGMAAIHPWWERSWQLPHLDRYEDIRVAVVPNEGALHGFEPRLLLAAQAAGCCVLAEEYPGIDDLHRDGETVVVWRKRQNPITVLQDLLADPSRMQRVATSGHASLAGRSREEWQKRMAEEIVR